MSRVPQWTRRRIVRFPATVAALAVLVPATVWFSAHGDYDQYRKSRATEAITVAPHRVEHWHGASWQLLSYRVDPAPAHPGDGAGSPPGTLVEARIKVRADSAAASKNLAGCAGGLRDSHNRRWGPGYVDTTAYPDASDGCSPPLPDYGKKPAPPTDPYTVALYFRVPQSSADEGTPIIVFTDARPKYLLLQH